MHLAKKIRPRKRGVVPFLLGAPLAKNTYIMEAMPPANPIPHEVTRPQKESAGPIVGIIIIFILAIFGALYFWGALLNKSDASQAPLPLIQGDAIQKTN